MPYRLFFFFFLFLNVFSTVIVAQEPKPELAMNNAELDQMTFRWVREFVDLIITDEEKSEFLQLETPEQRLAFIEQFWQRRDPTPGTPKNEAREEHARRFSYANQHFAAGKPGWKTERGRIYILLGPPQNRSSSPMGRQMGERASETWSYNGIKSRTLPSSFDLSFVDFNDTGDYQLVSNLNLAAPMLTAFGYVGNNLDLLARAVQSERFRSPEDLESERKFFDYQGLMQANMNLMRDMEAIQEVGKTADLPANEVETKLQFIHAPIQLSHASFRTGSKKIRLQTSFSLDFSEFSSKNYQQAAYFHIELFARLLSFDPAGAIADELRDTLAFQIPEDRLKEAKNQPLIYQIQHIAPPGRYIQELILRDAISGRISVTKKELELPALSQAGLNLSGAILCESIRTIETPEERSVFTLGNLELLPRVSGIFKNDETMHVYLQAYDATKDNAGTYELQIDYRIWSKKGALVSKTPSQQSTGQSQSVVGIITAIQLQKLPRGEYELEPIVWDKKANVRVMQRIPFAIR